MEITVFRRFWFTQLNVFSCKIFDFQSTANWILCYFFNITSKKFVFWYVRVCQNTHCLHWWPYIWQQFNSTNDCYLKLSLEIAIYIKFWTLSVFSSAFLTLSPLPPPAPPPPRWNPPWLGEEDYSIKRFCAVCQQGELVGATQLHSTTGNRSSLCQCLGPDSK